MLDGRGSYGTYLEEQATAVILTLHRNRQLRGRVVELWAEVQSRPCIDDQALAAVEEIARAILAARGLDPRGWRDHLEVMLRAWQRIVGAG